MNRDMLSHNLNMQSGRAAGRHSPNVVPGSFIRLSSVSESTEPVKFREFIEKLVRTKTAMHIRYTIATLCFFGFLGIIGGFEAGILSLGRGIFATVALLGIEILCLHR